MEMLTKLGWDRRPHAPRSAPRSRRSAATSPKANWKTDLSGGIQRVAIKHGCAPFGNGKARCVVWNFPDPRAAAPRAALHPPARSRGPSIRPRRPQAQPPAAALQVDPGARTFAKDFPIILTSGPTGRVRGRRRRDPLEPVARRAAAGHVRRGQPVRRQQPGRQGRQQVWVHGPETGKVRVMAMVTERVGKGVAFMPFHFGGHFQGKDLRGKYPAGRGPHRARRVGEHGARPTATTRDPDAGNQDDALQDRAA